MTHKQSPRSSRIPKLAPCVLLIPSQDEQARDNYASVKVRAAAWAQGAGVTAEMVAAMTEKYTAHVKAFCAQAEPAFERIFIRDGERSFNTPVRRTALCHMLTFLQVCPPPLRSNQIEAVVF